MPQKITWTMTVQVAEGPKLSDGRAIQVSAYDKVDVVIADGANNEDVEIQPSSAAQVRFLMITSDSYGEDLTYRVNEAGADPITLDASQVFIGQGAVGLLGADGPKTLLFTNGLGQDARVSVLVGRVATTP
jgi:hypothetical protein